MPPKRNITQNPKSTPLSLVLKEDIFSPAKNVRKGKIEISRAVLPYFLRMGKYFTVAYASNIVAAIDQCKEEEITITPNKLKEILKEEGADMDQVLPNEITIQILEKLCEPGGVAQSLIYKAGYIKQDIKIQQILISKHGEEKLEAMQKWLLQRISDIYTVFSEDKTLGRLIQKFNEAETQGQLLSSSGKLAEYIITLDGNENGNIIFTIPTYSRTNRTRKMKRNRKKTKAAKQRRKRSGKRKKKTN